MPNSGNELHYEARLLDIRALAGAWYIRSSPPFQPSPTKLETSVQPHILHKQSAGDAVRLMLLAYWDRLRDLRVLNAAEFRFAQPNRIVTV